MFQSFAAHPGVSKVWYVQLARRIGRTLRHQQINNKVHVIGLPNGLRGNLVPLLGQLNLARNASLLTRHIKLHQNVNDEVVYWFYDWGMADLLHKLPKKLTVMELRDHMEDLCGSNWRARSRLQKAKRQSLALTDLAIAVSPNLLPELASCSGTVEVEYNAIGKEFLTLARSTLPEPELLQRIPRPRLGVVGSGWSLNHRVDHELIARVAEILPDWQIVFVGCDRPLSKLTALCEKPNIHLFGMQPQLSLPAFIRHFDVCAVPYRKGKPRGDALKVYEYSACGRPTILTADEPHPVLRQFTRTVENPVTFARACEEFLVNPIDANKVASSMEYLTWEARASRCLDSVQKAMASQ